MSEQESFWESQQKVNEKQIMMNAAKLKVRSKTLCCCASWNAGETNAGSASALCTQLPDRKIHKNERQRREHQKKQATNYTFLKKCQFSF